MRLAADGAISEIERLDGKTRPDVWTLRNGKHNGFPGLKTGRGLIELDATARANHDELWRAARTPAAKRVELERVASQAVLDQAAGEWPKLGHRRRIADRLADLRVLEADRNTRAVPAAFQRFLLTLELAPPFLHRLYDLLLDRVRNGEDGWLDVAHSALVEAVPLVIDVTRDFARDAGDERQIEPVSRALSRAGSADGEEDTCGVCALTGVPARLLGGNFPQPTLPSLGQTYLFSRNADIRALGRYGRNGPSSLPVDADLVGRFSGALAAIVDEKRRGKTWRLLPAESGDGKDLFIAFIASAMDDAVADSLATAQDDDEEGDESSVPQSAEVEGVAKGLLEFWKGVAGRAKPHERARILLLRTVDPGNRKAVYEGSTSVSALHDAARAWSAAMKNAPDWIGWTIFVSNKAIAGHVRLQKPLSLIALSRKVYVRGGREAFDAPGISGAEALALFLHEGDRTRRARRVLRLLLDRQTNLLAGVAQANRRRQLKDFDPKAIVRVDALRSVAWIGALLSFMGRTKEIFMGDAGFKLGQLLSAADAVHMGYCAEVRGGDLPPTLVGNSVFAAAGRNPDRALDVLQTRWKPYHAWATKAGGTPRNRPEKDDNKGWTVFRAVSQARNAKQLCEELHPALALMRQEGRPPDEAFRAELLLGYVAGIRPEKKSDEIKSDQVVAAEDHVNAPRQKEAGETKSNQENEHEQ